MEEKTLASAVITVQPDSELYYHRGGRAFDQGKIEQAKIYFERGASLAESDEEWAFGMCQVALLHQATGMYESSMELFDELIEYQSTLFPEMFYFQANNYAFLEEFERALSLARYYLTISPDGEFMNEVSDFVKMVEAEALHLPE